MQAINGNRPSALNDKENANRRSLCFSSEITRRDLTGKRIRRLYYSTTPVRSSSMFKWTSTDMEDILSYQSLFVKLPPRSDWR